MLTDTPTTTPPQAGLTAEAAARLLTRAAKLPSLRAKYGDRLTDTDEPDWTALPALTKDELNTAIEELAALGPHERGGAYVYASGGTMSEPRLSFIPGEMFVADILERWQPLEPGDVLINLFTPGRMWSAHYFYNAVAVDSGAVVIPFGGMDEDEFDPWLDFFAAQGATAIAATPTTLKRVLMHAARTGRSLSGLRKVLWVGEKFDDATAALVAEHLPQAEIWGLYGSTETWVIGWNGPNCRPDTVHTLPYQHVELADDGAILVTNTHERCVNPLLRYRVGDLGEFAPCTCGASESALRVLGRADSYFKFLNQLISPEELVGLAAEVDGVLEAQLALVAAGSAAERLEIRVKPTADRSPDVDLADRVRARVLAGHLELGYVVADAPEKVDAQIMPELTSNTRTGKTPLLILEPLG